MLVLVECPLAARGRPVPAEELPERVWDEAADPFTSTVKTTIGRLRAKLGDPPVIQTVRDSPRGGCPRSEHRPVRRGVPAIAGRDRPVRRW